MKLFEISEREIETRTGTARLNADGSMDVDNSGYTQNLSREQVAAAWRREQTLPLAQFTIDDIMSFAKKGVSREDLANDLEEAKPRWNDEEEVYDFGDEMHTIPSKEEFMQ